MGNNTAIRVLRKGESEEIALAAWIAHLGFSSLIYGELLDARRRGRATVPKRARMQPAFLSRHGCRRQPDTGKEGHEASECLSWLRSSCGH